MKWFDDAQQRQAAEVPLAVLDQPHVMKLLMRRLRVTVEDVATACGASAAGLTAFLELEEKPGLYIVDGASGADEYSYPEMEDRSRTTPLARC